METRSLEYSETIDLLQQKIITYIRLNPSLNKHVRFKSRFVDNTPEAITFNFHEFSEAYQERYLDNQFESYCIKFVEFLKPVFVSFIKEIHYGGWALRVIIRYKGENFSKGVTVLNKEEDE